MFVGPTAPLDLGSAADMFVGSTTPGGRDLGSAADMFVALDPRSGPAT